VIEYREALVEEVDELKRILWKHGPNEWNYLTEEGVEAEFALIEQARARAVVATVNQEIVGFAVLITGEASPDYLTKYGKLEEMTFIGDVVVSSDHSGLGIATRLLNECITRSEKTNAKKVLIERHEENLASAGMMKKAGFKIIDTLHEPQKRTAGSQNSVILEFCIEE